ncbi:MAG TPA: osmotically inducible protein OsmC, partial [Chitinophagaceae bacterium]|nr:osmotically inducible protein OsmC [Chitinophagaceae bacterium]
DVAFTVKKNIIADAKQRVILERAAETCPVAKSIHPDIEVRIQWHWPEL